MIGVFRLPVLVGLALAVAFSGGIYSALLALDAQDPFEMLAIGPWVANPLAQTTGANPYAKARRALGGAPGLGQAEGLLFRTVTDSSGAALSASCGYAVTGQVPASRVWVMRLTGQERPQGALAPPFSRTIHSSSILRTPDGEFTVRLDDEARSGNWLMLEGSGGFGIEIILFDTPAAGNFGLIDLQMPAVEKLACADA
jgi:hypothetical protein